MVYETHDSNQYISAGTGGSWAGAWMRIATVLAVRELAVVGFRFCSHRQQSCVGQWMSWLRAPWETQTPFVCFLGCWHIRRYFFIWGDPTQSRVTRNVRLLNKSRVSNVCAALQQTVKQAVLLQPTTSTHGHLSSMAKEHGVFTVSLSSLFV